MTILTFTAADPLGSAAGAEFTIRLTSSTGVDVIGHVDGIAVYTGERTLEADATGAVEVDLIANLIVDDDDEVTPRYDQANTYYTVTRAKTGQSVLVEITETDTTLRDAMAEDPEPLDPTVAAQLVDDAVAGAVPDAVAAEVAGITAAGDAAGPLDQLVIQPGAVDADKVDSATVQITSQKGDAGGYLGLDANADLIPPASTLGDDLVVRGGVVRQAAGVHVRMEHTQTTGPTRTTVAAGSNGVNVATLVGAQSVASTTGDAPTAGTFLVVTSGEDALVSYTGKTAGAYTGCTLISGDGTMSTGAAIVVQPPEDDAIFGSGLWVEHYPTIDYDSGNRIVGPQATSVFRTLLGFGFPRAVVQLEGAVTADVDLSQVVGIGPWFQNNMQVTNTPGVARKIIDGLGYINSTAIIADGADCTIPDRVGAFPYPGGEQSWHVGFSDGVTVAGINGGTMSDVLGVSFTSQPVVLGGGHVAFHASFIASEAGIVDPLGTLPGTGVVDVQAGVLIGAITGDATLPPTKWTTPTTPVGFVNASTTIHVPDPVTVAAAFTIDADSTAKALTSSAARAAATAGAVITPLTATPWRDGQELILLNANTTAGRTLTFTSSATTKLSLGALTRVVGPGGSLSLEFSAAADAWIETGFSPGSSFNVNFDGLVTVADGNTLHGSVTLGAGALGPGVTWKNEAGDEQGATVLGGTALGLRLGDGEIAADWSLTHTGVATATVTGSLAITAGLTVGSGLTVSAGAVALPVASVATAAISGFDTQVRTNRIDQMAAPTAAMTWTGGSVTIGAVLTASGTDSDGSSLVGASSFFGGGLISLKGNAADSVGKAILTTGGVSFGPGGAGATDFIIDRTGTNAGRITVTTLTLAGNLSMSGRSIITDTTTGLRIATGATQKLAFFDVATPITRRTGWTTAPTGTLTRTTFDSGTVTLPQLAERVAALLVDIRAYGLIGA